MIGIRGVLQFLKCFYGADDRAVGIVHRDRANPNGHLMTTLVAKESSSLGGVRCLDGAGNGTILATEFASRLIAVQRSLSDTGVANDFVPQVSRDSLRTVAPEHDFLMHVDHAHPGRQAFENAAANIWIVE
jgi:hypothetical protein